MRESCASVRSLIIFLRCSLVFQNEKRDRLIQRVEYLLHGHDQWPLLNEVLKAKESMIAKDDDEKLENNRKLIKQTCEEIKEDIQDAKKDIKTSNQDEGNKVTKDILEKLATDAETKAKEDRKRRKREALAAAWDEGTSLIKFPQLFSASGESKISVAIASSCPMNLNMNAQMR